MRTEDEAEMEGFEKGLNLNIDAHFIGYMVVAVLGFLVGLLLGVTA